MKKSVFTVFILAMLCCFGIAFADFDLDYMDQNHHYGWTVGDVSNNWTCDNADLVILGRYLINMETLSIAQLRKADVNFDGNVDNTDLVKLSQNVVNSKNITVRIFYDNSRTMLDDGTDNRPGENGSHIHWSYSPLSPSSLYYEGLWENAVATWNSYTPGVFVPYDFCYYKDLEVYESDDVSPQTSGGTVLGETYGYGNSFGNVALYINQIADLNNNNKKFNVMLHEAGHCLGLSHNIHNGNNNDEICDVMYPYVTSQVSLSENDKASYDAAWLYYDKIRPSTSGNNLDNITAPADNAAKNNPEPDDTALSLVSNENRKEDIDDVSEIHASYCIDTDNYDELVAFADYVFVGQVLRISDVDYRNVTQYVTKNGSFEWGMPYTELHVIVDENIKGTLSDLILYKAGGIGMDQKTTYIYEDDMMPIRGERYIFTGCVQKDGSLLISGANSNIAFSEDTLKQIKESASKNPEFLRQRYKLSDLYYIEVDYR